MHGIQIFSYSTERVYCHSTTSSATRTCMGICVNRFKIRGISEQRTMFRETTWTRTSLFPISTIFHHQKMVLRTDTAPLRVLELRRFKGFLKDLLFTQIQQSILRWSKEKFWSFKLSEFDSWLTWVSKMTIAQLRLITLVGLPKPFPMNKQLSPGKKVLKIAGPRRKQVWPAGADDLRARAE